VIKIKMLNISQYASGLALLRENGSILSTWRLWILELLLIKMAYIDGFYMS
jgi:hypothetical protein